MSCLRSLLSIQVWKPLPHSSCAHTKNCGWPDQTFLTQKRTFTFKLPITRKYIFLYFWEENIYTSLFYTTVLQHAWKSVGGLIKMQISSSGVGPGSLISKFPVMWMLLVQGPHLEHYCSLLIIFIHKNYYSFLMSYVGTMLSAMDVIVKKLSRLVEETHDWT